MFRVTVTQKTVKKNCVINIAGKILDKKCNERGEDSINLREGICMLDQSIFSLISHTCGEIEEIRKVWDTTST